jgi:hypothetical protein
MSFSIVSNRHNRVSSTRRSAATPPYRPTVLGLLAWATVAALLVIAAVEASRIDSAALHRAVDPLFPSDLTAFTGFST